MMLLMKAPQGCRQGVWVQTARLQNAWSPKVAHTPGTVNNGMQGQG